MSELDDADVEQYRRVSAAAIFGLVLGLLSAAALLDTAAWILPPAGAALGGWALWRISHAPAEMVGRKAALCGLLLAVLFGAAGVTQWHATRWLLCRQARHFALVWFDALRHHQPQVAYALTLPPSIRQPEAGQAGGSRESVRWPMSFEEYLAQPIVKSLVALGERAEVRPCRTVSLEINQLTATVHELFAVASRQPDGATTLYVDVELRRAAVGPSGLADWYITNVVGQEDPGASQVESSPRKRLACQVLRPADGRSTAGSACANRMAGTTWAEPALHPTRFPIN